MTRIDETEPEKLQACLGSVAFGQIRIMISTPPQSISIIDLDSLLETVQWSRFWTLTIPVPPVHSNPTLTALWNYLRWLQSPVDSKDYEEF